ncbi:T9SS type A sorting domain-containing protein [Roseivirga seohaensis]|uniref:T9SS type A sorting domain-containing protein n=1 Tax=Roseivirga seohaensis TaxID=1914963 RepID=UPI003BAD722B
MKFIFTFTFFVCTVICSAQANFQSNVASGNWTAPGSWLLVSGSDADGIPDNDDNVTIQTGHTINIATTTTQNCNNLTIDRGTLAYTAGTGRLNVRGNFVANSTSGTRARLSGSSNNHRIVITGSSTVNASSHLEVIAVRITANGPTVLSGLLEFTTAQASNNIFTDLTINGSGTWTNNSTQNFAFNGSILNNSGNAMTPCSTVDGCNYVFLGDGESIGGTGTNTLTRLVINDPVTITNDGTLVVNDDIVGSGTLINDGSITVNTHAGGANFTLDNWDLNNPGSSFTYQGTTNETLDITFPFYDLVVNMDNGVLLQVLNNDVSVENNLTINSGEMRVRDNRTLAVTGNLSIAGANAEFSPFSTNNTVNIGGNLLMSDGNYDQNEGDVNVTGDIILTGGTMIISESGTSTLDATDMTITDAAVTLSSGTMTISNAAGGLTIDSDANNVAILSTLDVAGQIAVQSGTTILNSGADVTAGSIAISAGIFRPNNATVILDVTGDITTSSTGIYDQNDGDVNVSGDFNLTNGSAFLDGGTLDATDMAITTGDVQLRAGTMNVTNPTGGITINSGRLIMNGGNTLNVTNDLTIAGGELLFNDNTATINISGDLLMSLGEYDHNDGDMNISGDITITGGAMDLNETTASTIDATDMTLATGTVGLRAGTLTLTNAAGGLTVNSGAFNQLGTTVNIAGDFDINGGTVDSNTGALNFTNMDIATGGAMTLANTSITSTGTITVDNGSFTIDGAAGSYNFNSIDVNSNGSWLVTAPYSPTISGNLSNDGTFTGCNGAGCVYTLTSATGTISGTGAMNTMSDFLINAPATYTNTNSGGVDISDALGGTGAFINGANGSMLYGGSNTNFTISSFTASAVGNTVTYNRTVSNQEIQQTTDAGNNYYNLVINKADGQDVTTTADITIDNQLTMTAGDIIMGGQNIIMSPGATITGGNSISYIQDNAGGVLRYGLLALGTFFVPIGGDQYSPITLTLTSATIGGGASIDFSITDSAHPNRDRDNTGDSPAGDDDGTAATDYIDLYWTVSGNNITNPLYNASFIYDASDFTQTTESNMVGVAYRTIAGGTLDWFVGGTVNPTNNTVTVSDVAGFGDLYAMDNTTERLPIVLLSFNAYPSKGSINLQWVTAIEENNQLFTIERSADGKEFTPVLFVEGAGTTTATRSYSISDLNPVLGRSYYRLKQTDFNGQFEYSEVISVVYEGVNTFSFGLKGNVITTGEKLRVWSQNALELPKLMIRDIKGEMLLNKTLSPEQGEVEETSLLSAGIYFLTVSHLGRVETKKFIVR